MKKNKRNQIWLFFLLFLLFKVWCSETVTTWLEEGLQHTSTKAQQLFDKKIKNCGLLPTAPRLKPHEQEAFRLQWDIPDDIYLCYAGLFSIYASKRNDRRFSSYKKDFTLSLYGFIRSKEHQNGNWLTSQC